MSAGKKTVQFDGPRPPAFADITQIAREHPGVQALVDRYGGETGGQIEAMLIEIVRLLWGERPHERPEPPSEPDPYEARIRQTHQAHCAMIRVRGLRCTCGALTTQDELRWRY